MVFSFCGVISVVKMSSSSAISVISGVSELWRKSSVMCLEIFMIYLVVVDCFISMLVLIGLRLMVFVDFVLDGDYCYVGMRNGIDVFDVGNV